METPKRITDGLPPADMITLFALLNTRNRKEAAAQLGLGRAAMQQRTTKICNRTGIRPLGRILTQITEGELEVMRKLHATYEEGKRRRDSIHIWEWTYAAMNPREKLELAAQIRLDAHQIAERVGGPNRLLPLLQP